MSETGETKTAMLKDAPVAPRTSGDASASALGAFEECLASIVDKPAYDLAHSKCHSAIWKEEAPPRFFLAACEGDPLKAARLCVEYWQERRQLFHDRFDLPLMSTACEASTPSALNQQDLVLLETGSMQVLPTDKAGMTVFFVDRSRLNTEMHTWSDARMRCLFYLFTKALMDGRGDRVHQVRVLLRVAGTAPFQAYDWTFPKRFFALPKVFPIQLMDFHILSEGATNSSIANVVTSAAKSIIGLIGHHCGKPTHVHHCDREWLWKELRAYGLSKKRLPDSVGGNLTYEMYYRHWLERHRRREEALFWSADQRRRRKRDINAKHSKLKRLRRRDEHQQLQEECANLRASIEDARALEARLEKLLVQAKDVVNQSEANAPVAATASSALSGTLDHLALGSLLHGSSTVPLLLTAAYPSMALSPSALIARRLQLMAAQDLLLSANRPLPQVMNVSLMDWIAEKESEEALRARWAAAGISSWPPTGPL